MKTMISQATSEADVKKWQARFEELGRRKEELELELNQKINEQRMAKADPAQANGSAAPDAAAGHVPLETLIAALPAKGALVDYLEYTNLAPSEIDPTQMVPQRRLAAFVIRPGQPAGQGVKMFDLGPMEAIGKAIDQWRLNFGLGSSVASGGELKATIWAPLAESLADATTVLVSPDGALGRFPFAALPGKLSGTYLLEDVQVVLVPVPQLIPELMAGKVTAKLPKELLVMGGVDYDHRSTPGASLPTDQGDVLRPWERRRATPWRCAR